MKLLTETFKKTGNIHHIYAFRGEKTVVVPKLLKFLDKDFGAEIKNNPDFTFQEFDTFTIDDSRALKEQHGRKAVSDKKIFVISSRFITTEAQNALLKIFEEPFAGTHFFLILPNTNILLPTLRSRMVIVDEVDGTVSSDTESEMEILVKKFLAANVAERLSLLKPIIEEKEKGKAIDFVSALEKNLNEKKDKKILSENAAVLGELLTIKKYLHDRAPSIKLLLEHLALSVKIK